MSKKAAETEDKAAKTNEIIEINQEQKVMDIIWARLSESITPLIEIIVTNSTLKEITKLSHSIAWLGTASVLIYL